MVAFNFQSAFVAQIERGDKKQTIRKKARCQPGDKIQLYTGMRTKACRKIGDAICVSVTSIEIAANKIQLGKKTYTLDNPRALHEFARRDGFGGAVPFWYFFKDRYRLPFKGYLIKWKNA